MHVSKYTNFHSSTCPRFFLLWERFDSEECGYNQIVLGGTGRKLIVVLTCLIFEYLFIGSSCSFLILLKAKDSLKMNMTTNSCIIVRTYTTEVLTNFRNSSHQDKNRVFQNLMAANQPLQTEDIVSFRRFKIIWLRREV